jgi:hypothetical protein
MTKVKIGRLLLQNWPLKVFRRKNPARAAKSFYISFLPLAVSSEQMNIDDGRAWQICESRSATDATAAGARWPLRFFTFHS